MHSEADLNTVRANKRRGSSGEGAMPQDLTLTTATLRTPKAVAVAGILFSVLLVSAFAPASGPG